MVERNPEILVPMIQIIQYCAKLIEHTKNVTIEKVIYLSSKSKINVMNIKTLLRKLIALQKIRQSFKIGMQDFKRRVKV